MGVAKLEISSDIQQLLINTEKLSSNVKELAQVTDAYQKRTHQGYTNAAEATKTLSTGIKQNEQRLKALTLEYLQLAGNASKLSKAEQAHWQAVNKEIEKTKNNISLLKSKQSDLSIETSKGAGIFNKLGMAIGAAFSVYAIVNFMKQAATAWMEQEKAESKLRGAMGGRVDTQRELIKQADILQRITLFKDDDIINAEALLAINVKEKDQLKELVKVTLDLAAAKGMDLASAAQAVNMATMGQGRALKSLGIELDLTGSKEENVIKVTEALRLTVGGMAEEMNTGLAGSVHTFNVAWDELLESFGQLEKSGQGVTSWLAGMIDDLSKFNNDVAVIGFANWWRGFQASIWGDETQTVASQMKNFELGLKDGSDAIVELVENQGMSLEEAKKQLLDRANADLKELDEWNKKFMETRGKEGSEMDVTVQAGLKGYIKAITEYTKVRKKAEVESEESAANSAERLAEIDRLQKTSMKDLQNERSKLADINGDLILTGVKLQDDANKVTLELIDKELKRREDAAKKVYDIEKDKQAKLKELRDKEIKASENIGMKEIEIFKQQGREYEAIISLLTRNITIHQKAVETGAMEMRDTVSESLDEINNKIEETEQFSQDHPLFAKLGIKNEEQLNAVKDYVGKLTDFANEIISQQVEATERIVEDQNQRIDEQQQLVEQEFKLKEDGLANNYALEKDNLVKMQKARDEAIKDRERMIKIQRIMSTTESGIALVSAAANIIKGFSSIPVVGVVLGLAAVAAMIGGFLLMSTKAKDATKMEYGGQAHGQLSGKRHSQGGIAIEAEDKEWFINRNSSIKYSPLLNAINRDDRESMKLYFDRNFVTKFPNQRTDKDYTKHLDEIAKNTRKKQETIYGPGYIIEKSGGYTKIIHLN
jgi:hypothetical protein